MDILAPAAWPVWVATLLLIVAAAVNVRTLLVPNWLTLGGILSGWIVGVLATAGVLRVSGGFGPSLVATAIGFGLLIPWASRGVLGVGCVKAQMAFGAWLGCAADLETAAVAAVAAGVAGSLALGAAAGVIVTSRRADGAQRAAWTRLPAQVPLSLGSIAGVAAAVLWV